jgi:hypothetical protein
MLIENKYFIKIKFVIFNGQKKHKNTENKMLLYIQFSFINIAYIMSFKKCQFLAQKICLN